MRKWTESKNNRFNSQKACITVFSRPCKSSHGRKIARIAFISTIFGRNRLRRSDLFFFQTFSQLPRIIRFIVNIAAVTVVVVVVVADLVVVALLVVVDVVVDSRRPRTRHPFYLPQATRLEELLEAPPGTAVELADS